MGMTDSEPIAAFKERQRQYRNALDYADDAKEAMKRALAEIPAVDQLAIELYVFDTLLEEDMTPEFAADLRDPVKRVESWVSLTIESERDEYRAIALRTFELAGQISEHPLDRASDLEYLIKRCEVALDVLEDPNGVKSDAPAIINEAIMAVRTR